MSRMDDIAQTPLAAAEAAIWFLGQAGYIIRSCGVTLAIDPYLSDSVGAHDPPHSRLLPVPISPADLKVDVFIVTHDHLDHLDPDTIRPYSFKSETVFVAPNLAAATLVSLGVPEANVARIDRGQSAVVSGVNISGVFAIPTGDSVSDTTGYRLEFQNGRSLYHSSDTAFSEELVANVPPAEVALVCINGKWGNLDVPQAVRVAAAAEPRFAIPNHFDMMALNSADPALFRAEMRAGRPDIEVRILKMLDVFTW